VLNVAFGSKPVVLWSSTRFPLRSPNPTSTRTISVQDAPILTKSASSKATSVCPHLPLINSGSGFCRGRHSTAHYRCLCRRSDGCSFAVNGVRDGKRTGFDLRDAIPRTLRGRSAELVPPGATSLGLPAA
jgi:hypothetical protein